MRWWRSKWTQKLPGKAVRPFQAVSMLLLAGLLVGGCQGVAEGLDSEAISLDDTWSQYINPRLDISIRFPKMMMATYGSCRWSEEGEDYSYRPEAALVPVRVFEDANTIYIAAEYYYELTGESCQDGRCTYAECTKVMNTPALLQDPENMYQQMWKLVVEKVQDDEELDAFIKSRYGVGCKLGEKESVGQQGVYAVGVEEERGREEECPYLHWTYASGYEIRYCENTNQAIAIYLNGYSTFLADERGNVTYDEEMRDSFRCEAR
jgi:hypothetical protein